MPAPKYNVVAAPGWDDDGPLSPSYDLGGTDDPAEVAALYEAARRRLAKAFIDLPAWVVDIRADRPFERGSVGLLLLLHWDAAKDAADAHIAACRGVPA